MQAAAVVAHDPVPAAAVEAYAGEGVTRGAPRRAGAARPLVAPLLDLDAAEGAAIGVAVILEADETASETLARGARRGEAVDDDSVQPHDDPRVVDRDLVGVPLARRVERPVASRPVGGPEAVDRTRRRGRVVRRIDLDLVAPLDGNERVVADCWEADEDARVRVAQHQPLDLERHRRVERLVVVPEQAEPACRLERAVLPHLEAPGARVRPPGEARARPVEEHPVARVRRHPRRTLARRYAGRRRRRRSAAAGGEHERQAERVRATHQSTAIRAG